MNIIKLKYNQDGSFERIDTNGRLYAGAVGVVEYQVYVDSGVNIMPTDTLLINFRRPDGAQASVPMIHNEHWSCVSNGFETNVDIESIAYVYVSLECRRYSGTEPTQYVRIFRTEQISLELYPTNAYVPQDIASGELDGIYGNIQKIEYDILGLESDKLSESNNALIVYGTDDNGDQTEYPFGYDDGVATLDNGVLKDAQKPNYNDTEISGMNKYALKDDIVNDLSTLNQNKMLSAEQGVILYGYITDLQTRITKLYEFKGSVETYTELLAITGQKEGDVYNVREETVLLDKTYPAGTNFAWSVEEMRWDALGGHIDLSNYFTKDEIMAIVESLPESIPSSLDKIGEASTTINLSDVNIGMFGTVENPILIEANTTINFINYTTKPNHQRSFILYIKRTGENAVTWADIPQAQWAYNEIPLLPEDKVQKILVEISTQPSLEITDANGQTLLTDDDDELIYYGTAGDYFDV